MNQKKRCFIIMPFGKSGTDEFDRNLKIYQIMIKPVVEACNYQSIRADELEHFGNITRDIIELLHESDLVIADLSGKNANVFYELGVRHALYRCGTIPIIREGETLPFDIANYRAIFYSSELDGPERFRKELEKRIKAFERLQQRKSDNQVHDILGDKLIPDSRDDYIEKSIYEEKLQQLNAATKELKNLRQLQKVVGRKEQDFLKQIQSITNEKTLALKKVKELEKQVKTLNAELQQARQAEQQRLKKRPVKSKPTPLFRTEGTELAEDDVKDDFYCGEYDWSKNFCNASGKGLKHQFEAKTIKGDKVVLDQASDLMWQQSGSPKWKNYESAKNYINGLNRKGFAGFKDWRLPTLEEAMSLMEPEKKKNGLYIDPMFDSEQFWIWTCDPVQGESGAAWVVVFDGGDCNWSNFDNFTCVRAVRSRQSSTE